MGQSGQILCHSGPQVLHRIFPATGRHPVAFRASARSSGCGAVARRCQSVTHILSLTGLESGSSLYENCLRFNYDVTRLVAQTFFRKVVPGRYTSDELDVRFMGISNTCYRYVRTGSGSSLYRSSFYCPILRSQWTVQSSDWSASVPVVSDRNSSHGILCVAAETVQKVIRAHQEWQVSGWSSVGELQPQERVAEPKLINVHIQACGEILYITISLYIFPLNHCV